MPIEVKNPFVAHKVYLEIDGKCRYAYILENLDTGRFFPAAFREAEPAGELEAMKQATDNALSGMLPSFESPRKVIEWFRQGDWISPLAKEPTLQ